MRAAVSGAGGELHVTAGHGAGVPVSQLLQPHDSDGTSGRGSPHTASLRRQNPHPHFHRPRRDPGKCGAALGPSRPRGHHQSQALLLVRPLVYPSVLLFVNFCTFFFL